MKKKKVTMGKTISLVFSFFLLLMSSLMMSSCDSSSVKLKLGIGSDYRELCRNNDYEGAHRVLDALYNQYTDATREYNEQFNEFIDRKKKYKTLYLDALDYIFNKEALFLFSLEDEQANKRITYLLTEIPVRGTRPSDEGTEYIESDADEFSGHSGYDQAISWYQYYEYCSDYNVKCTQLLDLAIANSNKGIAKKLLAMYKEDIVIVRTDIRTAYTNNGQFYQSSTKSKDAAKVKYEEAFGKD